MKKKLIGSTVPDIIIGFILMVLTVMALYFEWKPTKHLEYRLYDAFSNLKEKTFNSPIVVVAVDDESIANMGRWPWPRSYIARVVEFLNRCGARVIGINIVYSDKDMSQGLAEVRDILKNMEKDTRLLHNAQINSIYTSLQETEKKLDNDAILGKAIGESKKVVLPLVFILDSSNTSKESDIPDYLKRNSMSVANHDGFIAAKQIITPIPDFAMKAMALGHVNVFPDSDGKVRSESLFVSYGERAYPSFGLQLSLKYLNYDMTDVSIGKGVNFGDNSISTSDKGEMLISFSKRVPYLSFYDVVSNKVPPEAFKDKIVIITQSAVGLGALQATPVGSNVPSWGIIANAADNILTGNYIVRPPWAFSLEMGVVIFFGLFAIFIVPTLKIRISAIASLILLFVWIGMGMYILTNYGYWLKLVHPSLLLLMGYILVVTNRRLFYGRRKGAHRGRHVSLVHGGWFKE